MLIGFSLFFCCNSCLEVGQRHEYSSHKQVESLVLILKVWTWGVQRKSHNVNKNINSFESKGECDTTLVKREVGNLI
jgi:hypothetical protein